MTDFTTYTVKNTSSLDKAFRVRGGFTVVAAGSDGEVANARPLSEAQMDAFAKEGVKISEKAKKKAETGLKAEHHGGGKFRITEGEKVILTDLSKSDADAFNALSDADKAAFVADKAKG